MLMSEQTSQKLHLPALEPERLFFSSKLTLGIFWLSLARVFNERAVAALLCTELNAVSAYYAQSMPFELGFLRARDLACEGLMLLDMKQAWRYSAKTAVILGMPSSRMLLNHIPLSFCFATLKPSSSSLLLSVP